MSSEWLKVMLDEVARKQAEAQQAADEADRRRAEDPQAAQHRPEPKLTE